MVLLKNRSSMGTGASVLATAPTEGGEEADDGSTGGAEVAWAALGLRSKDDLCAESLLLSVRSHLEKSNEVGTKAAAVLKSGLAKVPADGISFDTFVAWFRSQSSDVREALARVRPSGLAEVKDTTIPIHNADEPTTSTSDGNANVDDQDGDKQGTSSQQAEALSTPTNSDWSEAEIAEWAAVCKAIRGDMKLWQIVDTKTLKEESSLSLQGVNNLGDTHVKLLGRVLQLSRVMSALILRCTRLDMGCVNALSAAITAAPWLQTLDVSRCGITDGGLQVLCGAIAQASSLSELLLENSGLGQEGSAAIAGLLRAPGSPLRNLQLGYSRIDLARARALGEGLNEAPALQQIDLTECQIDDDALKALLPGALPPMLIMLTLCTNQIGDDGACALAKAVAAQPGRALQTLDLRGNEIKDRGMESIAALAHGGHLRTLNLQSNEVGEAGAAAIAEVMRRDSFSLREMDIFHNKIGESGAQAIAGALGAPECGAASLRTLNVGQNEIGRVGGMAFAEGLIRHSKMERIVISDCEIGLDGRDALGAACSQTGCAKDNMYHGKVVTADTKIPGAGTSGM